MLKKFTGLLPTVLAADSNKGRSRSGNALRDIIKKKNGKEYVPIVSNRSMLFAGDSLVNLLVLPGNEEARRMTVTSGHTCCVSLKSFGPLGLLVRTLLESSRWESPFVFLKWTKDPLKLFSVRVFQSLIGYAPISKELVTKSNRFLYRLVPSVPRIGGIAFGLLPTVTAYDAEKFAADSKNNYKGLSNRAASRNIIMPESIDKKVKNNIIKFFPTPVASDSRGSKETATERRKKGREVDLCHLAREWLPTVRAADSRFRNLEKTVKNIKNNGSAKNMLTGKAAEAGGCLNPDWVEWLMGFPSGWTNISKKKLIIHSGWNTESIYRTIFDTKDIPDWANRIKSLGNAVVPQVVTEIGLAIIAAELK